MAVVTNLGNNANVVTFNTVDTLIGGTSTVAYPDDPFRP